MNFQTGDVVKYIGKDSMFTKRTIHIINECHYIGKGKFEYSTNHGAWYTNKDFKLIRKADSKSFKQLDKDIEAEYNE